FQVLAGDDPPAANLEVGELARAHLVIQQVAGQPGDGRRLVDRVGEPLGELVTGPVSHAAPLPSARFGGTARPWHDHSCPIAWCYRGSRLGLPVGELRIGIWFGRLAACG